MKKILSFLSGPLIIAIITYIISSKFQMKFIDLFFTMGLIASVLIYFFSSSGGLISKHTNRQIQGQTGLKVKQDENKFHSSFFFYGSVLYTVVSLIVTVIYYKDYFFK